MFHHKWIHSLTSQWWRAIVAAHALVPPAALLSLEPCGWLFNCQQRHRFWPTHVIRSGGSGLVNWIHRRVVPITATEHWTPLALVAAVPAVSLGWKTMSIFVRLKDAVKALLLLLLLSCCGRLKRHCEFPFHPLFTSLDCLSSLHGQWQDINDDDDAQLKWTARETVRRTDRQCDFLEWYRQIQS